MPSKFENGVLTFYKYDTSTFKEQLTVNIMSDIQNSYKWFINEGIYDAMKYLQECINELDAATLYDAELHIDVKPLKSLTYMETQTQQRSCYYPVYGYFSRRGYKNSDDFELLRIPYMDDYGRLNYEGKSKVLLIEQRASNDVSFDSQKCQITIAMPRAKLRISGQGRDISIIMNKKAINLYQLICALLYEVDPNADIDSLFASTTLVTYLQNSGGVALSYVHQYFTEHQNKSILAKLKSEQYRLGDTRNSLNEALSLYRAVGFKLSREQLGYQVGDVVTQEMVNEFIRAGLNVIYVQDVSVPEGYTLAKDECMIFTDITAGTPNCAFLREYIPAFADEPVIPVNVTVDPRVYGDASTYDPNTVYLSDPIILDSSRPLTKDAAEFLISAGFNSIKVTAGKSAKSIVYSFEREIVGNYTTKRRILSQTVADYDDDTISADDWVYYYKYPDNVNTDMDHLTVHDFIALFSIMGYAKTASNIQFLNMDTAYLKRVMLPGDSLYESLILAIGTFVKQHSNSIKSNAVSSSGINPFIGLTKLWIKNLYSKRLLVSCDSLNLLAEVTQVNHIVTDTADIEVKDEQRHLAMPLFGRVCPYDTPAGKKLGITNTKAIGARVRNGLLETAYRAIIRTAKGLHISDKLTWFNAKQELNIKVCDLLSLKFDENGTILNTKVLVRIPSGDNSEPYMFTNIEANDLGFNGYVLADPEQFLSPPVAMVPFACSDNSVRLSYGASQMKQAIYLLNSQVPLVYTDMHEDIFNYTTSDTFLSPYTGRIVDIDNNYAHIIDDHGVTHEIPIQTSSNYGNLNVTVDIMRSAGANVNAGDVIAIAHKFPQPFVTRSPIDGVVTKIDGNDIIFGGDVNGYMNFEKPDFNTVSIQNSRIFGQTVTFTNIKVSKGDTVHKGDILADTCVSRDGVYSPARNPLVAMISYGYNHEDGVCATEKGATNYTSMSVHNLTKSIKVHRGTYTQSNPSLGFKYCRPGDTAVTISIRNASKYTDVTQIPIRANIKATGIPFEAKTVSSDKFKDEYRVSLLSINKLKSGDKMAGRHGNKGVVSKVLKDSQAPQLTNGMTVEFILNPLGVPSRMNIGQIDELHLSLICHVLGIHAKSQPFNGASVEDIGYYMNYTYDLANTLEIGSAGNFNKAAFDAVCRQYSKVPQEVHAIAWSNIANIVDWRGVFDRTGSARLFDPETGTFFEYPVVIGFPTYFKLMQEADEKVNSRSGPLTERYAAISQQPNKDEDSAKGQRMAEMELMALIAARCPKVIDEVINEKADNAGRRTNLHVNQMRLGSKYLLDENSCKSRSVENLIYFFEALGVKMECDTDIVDVSYAASVNKETLDINKAVLDRYPILPQHSIVDTRAEIKDQFFD